MTGEIKKLFTDGELTETGSGTNKEKHKQRYKEYYLKNKQQIKEYNQKPEVKARRKAYKQTPEYKAKTKTYNQRLEIKAKKREYEQKPEHKARKKIYKKAYDQRPEVKAKRKIYIKDYIKKNKISVRKRKSKYHKKMYNNNPEYKIRHILRSNLRRIFKNYIKQKNIQSSSQYGIDYEAIIKHLKPFPKQIKLYHIDHIIPLVSFNFVNIDGSINEKEIQHAFLPENHQWLFWKKNLSKGKKHSEETKQLLEVINKI
jgi:hypothetical protein